MKMDTETTTVEPFNSSHVGQVHFFNSSRVSATYSARRLSWPCHHKMAKTAPMTATQINALVKLFTKSFLARSVFAPSDRRSAHKPARLCASHFGAAAFALLSAASGGWRRGRDSNPRSTCVESGFQDRRDRPLCHLSPADPAA